LFGVGSALVAVVALAGATGGSAQTGVTSLTNDDCPPTNGRVFCVVLTTYDNAQRIGGLRVDLQLQNYDQNTLTNPVVQLTWGLPPAKVAWTDPKPASCSQLPDTPTGDQLISCAFANLPGVGSGGGFIPSPVVSLYFDAHVADADVLDWTATGFLNESGNDPPTVPNTSVRTVTVTQGFSSGESNDATTFALPESTVQLGTLQLGQSTLRFPVLSQPGDTPFPASFSAVESTDFCFDGLSCIALELTSVIEGPTGLKIWNFFLENTSLNPNSLRIIHRYDLRGATSISGNRFQSDVSYVGSDGVRLENLTGLGSLEAKDYFVVKATETTFQISNKRGGKPIPFPAGGTASAERIRIVGDQKAEHAASCDDADLSVKVPSMSATRVGSDIEACLADFDNGRIGPGG
jgi:hypothetical protein